MKKAAIPFALFTVLVFISPVKGISIVNELWILFTLVMYYVFFTMYVTPYFTLISELGNSPEEKLDLATYISFTWFIGYAIASVASILWNILEPSLGLRLAMQVSVGILALIALVFMMIPVIKIDERKYVRSSEHSGEGFMEALKNVFKNRDYRYFAISDLAYWIAVTIFQTGTVYYITILVGLEDSFVGTVTIGVGLFSFLLYAPINKFAKKIGKKKLMIIGFLVMSVSYSFVIFLGKYPIPEMVEIVIVIALFGIPMAIFGILPNAIIADVAEYDLEVSGKPREAMFFGVRTFMSKIGQTIAMLVFTSFLFLGKDAGDDLGIRLTALFAASLLVVSLVIFTRYNEKRILGGASEKR